MGARKSPPAAAFIRDSGPGPETFWPDYEPLQGKELSYNNGPNNPPHGPPPPDPADAGWEGAVRTSNEPAWVIVKHANPFAGVGDPRPDGVLGPSGAPLAHRPGPPPRRIHRRCSIGERVTGGMAPLV